MTPSSDLYTPEAEAQLDELQLSGDPELYNAILDAIDHVLDNTGQARMTSPPLRDSQGKPILGTVVMYDRDPRWFVFWAERPIGVVILGAGPLQPI